MQQLADYGARAICIEYMEYIEYNEYNDMCSELATYSTDDSTVNTHGI
jgi:hypothetical protein